MGARLHHGETQVQVYFSMPSTLNCNISLGPLLPRSRGMIPDAVLHDGMVQDSELAVVNSHRLTERRDPIG